MSDNKKDKLAEGNPLSIEEATKLIAEGASIGILIGMDEERLEILYAVAYSLYNGGKFADAVKVFRALCVYDGTQVRFWLGLGGCLQQLGHLEDAAEVYAMGATMSGLKDPEPMFYAAQCFLKLKRREDAINTLRFIDIMGREGDLHDAEFKKKAHTLIETLNSVAK